MDETFLFELRDAADRRGYAEALLRRDPSRQNAERFEYACKEVNRIMEQLTGITHACPVDGSGVTGCCGKTPFELPAHHCITIDKTLVTCTGKVSPNWVWIPPQELIDDDCHAYPPLASLQRIDVEAVDAIKPGIAAPGTVIDPDDQVKGSIQIPVDKTRYRIRHLNETEHYVDLVIEPK